MRYSGGFQGIHEVFRLSISEYSAGYSGVASPLTKVGLRVGVQPPRRRTHGVAVFAPRSPSASVLDSGAESKGVIHESEWGFTRSQQLLWPAWAQSVRRRVIKIKIKIKKAQVIYKAAGFTL